MKVIHLLFAGAAAATALLSGVYSVAATAATSLAASISTQETARHTRSVEFHAMASQSAATYPLQARERKPTIKRKAQK